ncbi:MAG: hypothetical protein Q8R32_01590 [bacterium]|nr:hypothetical protein [bacterium]
MHFALPEQLQRLLAAIALVGIVWFSGGAPRGVLGATVLGVLLLCTITLVPRETVAVSLAISAFLAIVLLPPWPILVVIPPPLRLVTILLVLGVLLALLLSGLLRRRPRG